MPEMAKSHMEKKRAHNQKTVPKSRQTEEERKKAEKWWECHTFLYNTAGQRLMCVFKEIAGVP